MMFVVIVAVALGVAYANGANDNFKGVATLFGSGTTNYKRALWWATITTALGSVAALMLAGNLIKSFGGKGLIDDVIVVQPAFASAVAFGTALTILIATRLGMPVSTTHGLIGALIGTGWVAGSSINYQNLGNKFLIPLLLSPVIAVTATAIIYPLLRRLRERLGVTSEYCLCVGQEVVEVVPAATNGCQLVAVSRQEALTATTGETVTCRSKYNGKVLGVSAGETLNCAHFVSSVSSVSPVA